MYSAHQYSETQYSETDSVIPPIDYLNLSESVGLSDLLDYSLPIIGIDLSESVSLAEAVEYLIPMSLAEVVGASDGVDTFPAQIIIGDSIRINDWVRLERKPSNSPFQGE